MMPFNQESVIIYSRNFTEHVNGDRGHSALIIHIDVGCLDKTHIY